MIVKTHDETDVKFRGEAASHYLLAANVDTHSWNSDARLTLFYFFLYQGALCNVLILDTKKNPEKLDFSSPELSRRLDILASNFPHW